MQTKFYYIPQQFTVDLRLSNKKLKAKLPTCFIAYFHDNSIMRTNFFEKRKYENEKRKFR